MFFIFFVLQHIKLSSHPKYPREAPNLTAIEFNSHVLCSKLQNASPNSRIQVLYSASIDDSCFPEMDLSNSFEIIPEPLLRLEGPAQADPAITLTIKLKEKPRCQYLKINGNIDLVINAENLEFEYLDISGVRSVKANNPNLTAYNFYSKWSFIKNFKTISFVHLSLTGTFEASSSKILNQQLRYLDSNSIAIDFSQNANVAFSKNQMNVTVGNTHSIIYIPNYNFTTSFYFSVGESLSFGVSGDIQFSKNFKNYFHVDPKSTDKARPNKITFGPGNYSEIGIDYTQKYGELTINNVNNFSSITLDHLTSFTPRSNITVTNSFQIDNQDETTGGPLDCNIITKSFNLACNQFNAIGIKKLSTKDGSAISISLNQIHVSYGFYGTLEIVKGTLTFLSSPCDYVLDLADNNLTVDVLQIPNDLVLVYRRYIDSATSQDYGNIIKTKSISGNGKIHFRIDEDNYGSYDAIYANPKAGESLFTPFIRIDNRAPLDRFVVSSIYSERDPSCIDCESQPDPMDFNHIPPTSYYQIRNQTLRGETFYGVYQNATFNKYNNFGSESLEELQYYIIDSNSVPPECTGYSQCKPDGKSLASLFTSFTKTIQITSYLPSTTLDLSFINHDCKLQFNSMNGAAIINITGVPQNSTHLKGITIEMPYGLSTKVIITPSFKFYGSLTIDYENCVLEGKDLELNGEISIRESKCLAGKIRITNESTILNFGSTLGDLQKLANVVTFVNKNSVITLDSGSTDIFYNLTFQKGQWTYYVQDFDQNFNLVVQPTRYVFTNRDKYPIIIIHIHNNCRFIAEPNCDSLNNTRIFLHPGSGPELNFPDSDVQTYNEYITETYNQQVRFYTFKGFKSISQIPFYISYPSGSSGDNCYYDITILDNGEANDNVLPINLQNDEQSISSKLFFYITLPNKYTELVIDSYVSCQISLVFLKANNLISKSQLSKVVFTKYVDVRGISSSLTIHLMNNFSVGQLPENLLIQNSSETKIIDLNASTTITNKFFTSGYPAEYTLNFYVTFDSMMDGARLNLGNQYDSWSNQAPKINIIFEDSHDVTLFNPDCPQDVTELINDSPSIPIVISGFNYLDLLAEKISFQNSEMSLNDKKLVFRTILDFGFNQADQGTQYSDKYENGQLIGRANKMTMVGYQLDQIQENSNSSGKDKNGKLPGWGIALIVIGILLFLALIIILIICLIKKGVCKMNKKVEAASA